WATPKSAFRAVCKDDPGLFICSLLSCFGLKRKLELRASRAAEMFGGRPRPFVFQTGFAASDVEHLGELIGKDALALHARAEVGIVQFAAAHRTNSVQDIFLSARKMEFEPPFEHRRHRVRQTNRHKTR